MDEPGITCHESDFKYVINYFDYYSDKITEINFTIEKFMTPEIMATICKLKNLKILNLSNQNINYLPIEFGNLISLKKLILNSNKLLELPSCIKKLEKLEFISIHEPYIKSLPEEFGCLTNLNTISIDFVPKTSYCCDNKMLIYSHSSSSVIPPNTTHLNIIKSNYFAKFTNLPHALEYLNISSNIFNFNEKNIYNNLPVSLKVLKINYGSNLKNIKLPFGCELWLRNKKIN